MGHIITFDEFQNSTARTSKYAHDPQYRMYMSAYGVSGESGELIDHLKKHFLQDHKLDDDTVKKELGDCMFYVSEGLSGHDIRLVQLFGKEFDEYESILAKFVSITYPASSLFGMSFTLSDLAGQYASYVYERWVLAQPPLPGGVEVLRDLWQHLGCMCQLLGHSMMDVAWINKTKLEKRYPTGFESNRSINRKENVSGC